MYKHIATAILAAGAVLSALPAHAYIIANGQGSQGIRQNALTGNALTGNALTANALTGNALTGNGIQSGTQAGRIVAVTLPEDGTQDGDVQPWPPQR